MIPRRNLLRNLRKAFAEPGYAGRVFSKRLMSFLTYKLSQGGSAFPETISLFLTYRCNLRCRMCGQWGEAGSSRGYTADMLKEQLSLGAIEMLVDELSSFKPNVTLFGGEPMLYKDWTRVVGLIKGRGMRCNMITNGILLEANAEALIEAGIDEIIFSLDGPREIHDEIRGTAGTYDRAMAGFKKLARLKKERGMRSPLVNISSTIFEINYKRLAEVVGSAEEMDASSITFHHLIFTGRAIYVEHDRLFKNNFSCSPVDWTGFTRDTLPDIDTGILLDMIRKIKSLKTPLHLSFYPNLTDEEVRRYYTRFDFLPDSYKRRCLSPWMVSYIFPDGSVRPCQSLNYAFGNIKESSFERIWNCGRATEYRKALKRDGYFPVCPRCTEFYRY